MAEYVVKKMDINTFLYTLWILYFLESRAGHQIFKVKCISVAHVKITAVDQSAVKESLALFYSGLALYTTYLIHTHSLPKCVLANIHILINTSERNVEFGHAD